MVHKRLMKDPEERRVYDRLIESCLCSGSEEKLAKLGNLKLELSYAFKGFHKQIEAFKEEISEVSISVFIAMWADIVREDAAYCVERLKMMADLVEVKLLPLMSLKDFSKLNFSSILDSIRCFEKWTIAKREDIVLLYLSFISWLCKETFNYVPDPIDPDREASQKRQVSFKTYIGLLERLDLRERILAKIFYLGGARALEEVLSVRIEDVDFKKRKIQFSEEVFYPAHLFEDIRKYTEGRKKGYLFEGRKGERISHTTTFRALKRVAADLKLDPEFTFKELTK
jgi:integrase